MKRLRTINEERNIECPVCYPPLNNLAQGNQNFLIVHGCESDNKTVTTLKVYFCQWIKRYFQKYIKKRN